MSLLAYSFNIASQNGEDGIIDELVYRLEDGLGKSLDGSYAFECGAWDGMHLSNTWYLTKKRNFKVVAVEREPDRFADLQKTSRQNPNILPVHAELSPTEDSIGDILGKFVGDKDTLALLSIDIDGLDYDVWKMYDPPADRAPMIVVIEIESSFPPWKRSVDRTKGASFSEMLELGVQKGYELVAHTGNMIFVRKDLVGYVGSFPKPVELFRPIWLNAEDKRTYSRMFR